MPSWMYAEAVDDACEDGLDPSRCLLCAERAAKAALEECASCGHRAPAGEMIADLKLNWEPTGKRVCRDADGCFTRRLARDREQFPPGALRDQSDALRGDGEAPRYCGTCHDAGNDDSRLGRDVVHNVEGAGPDGIEADACEAGHVFPVSDDNEEATDA